MAEFKFLQNPITKKWIILDPARSKRPNVGHKAEQICPFCIGREGEEQELYRVGGEERDSNWHIRVVRNKFPFAPIHEIVIHSPDHHKNFEELPLSHIELILGTYRARYLENQSHGQVYIFHNRGIGGGESLPHPHTQVTVIPKSVTLDLPPLDTTFYPSSLFFKKKKKEETVNSSHFYIYCPLFSQWPDEVWVVPMQKGKCFGDITDKEITDLAFILSRLIGIFDLRHGHEFPFNFYIYPGKNWYLRIFPRIKILGGFEMGSGIVVNTQDRAETFAFIKEHFFEPNLEKIRVEQKEDYWKSV
ncbi:hypothetical protein KJ980_05460 [Patescibacteria group bacterium]|nr:hypothetical protein [Patescibacteria group bacterium]MBU4099068.1 hypothetical protein [Patescibacteria group bacterium]